MPDWTERLTEEERDSFWLTHRQHIRVEKYAGGSRPITELNRQFANAFRTIADLRALVEEKDQALAEGASAWADYFRRTARWDTGETPALVVRLENALALTEDDMRKRLEERQ